MEKLKPKLFSVMKTYTREQFVKDVVAGIIVAIIALPLSIALALASGVTPEKGIYTAITAGFVISFLGGSRVQIAGPTAAFATIVAGIVAKNGMDGLIIATLLAGVILILMGLLRLGNLIKFIPYTITTGFTSGIAVTIFIGQIKDFLGLSIVTDEPLIETMDKLKAVFVFIGTLNVQALIVGILSLAILIFWPMLPGFLKRIPASGVLPDNRSERPARRLYDRDFSSNRIPALLCRCRQYGKQPSPLQYGADRTGRRKYHLRAVRRHPRHRSHRQNRRKHQKRRTHSDRRNGAFCCPSAVLVVLMPYAALIPMPVIAAILFMVAYNMCDIKTFVNLCKTSPKSDIIVLVSTFVLTVVFDLVVAIEVGILLAAILFMKRMSDVTEVEGWKYVDEDDDADSLALRVVPSHITVYEISGPLFFGAADKILKITLDEKRRCLVLRMRSVSAIDATAMHNLEKLYEDCQKKGIQLIFSHVNEQPWRVMEKNGFIEKVGADNFCAHIDDALKRAEQL